MDSYRERFYSSWLARAKEFIDKDEYKERDSVIAFFDAVLRDMSSLTTSLDTTSPINKNGKLAEIMARVPDALKEISEGMLNSRNNYERELCRKKMRNIMSIFDNNYNEYGCEAKEMPLDSRRDEHRFDEAPLRQYYGNTDGGNAAQEQGQSERRL